MPKSFSEYGSPLSFREQEKCSVTLRHFLSGRLLSSTQNSKGEFVPELSEEFSEYCQKWTLKPENKHLIEKYEKQLARKNLDLNKVNKNKLNNVLSDSETEEESEEQIHLPNIISIEFFEKYSLNIIREVSADEDTNLLVSNLLQIQDQEGRTLKIHKSDHEMFTGEYGTEKKCAFYQSFYYKVCT